MLWLRCTCRASAARPACRTSQSKRHSSPSTTPRRQICQSAKRGAASPEAAQPLHTQPERQGVESSDPASRLPVSPLADKSFVDARNRWRTPKSAKAQHKLTKFQRKLANNPFAQILASPDRNCPVTKTHVPRDLLQSFKLMAHPESGDPWWVPPDLAAAIPAQSPGMAASAPPSESGASAAVARGPTVYTLARRDLLRSFSDTSGKYRNGFKAFLRMSDSPGLTSTLNRAVWRKDMDSHILELMRRRISEDLLYLSALCESQDRQYLVPLETPDQLAGLYQLGCIFLLEEVPAQTDVRDQQPPVLDVGGRWSGAKVPVYGIHHLLGDAHTERLKAESPIFRSAPSVLLRGRRTVALQKRLWRLLGYIS